MGLGPSPMEIAVIAIIALIVLGPNKLPEAARSLGKGFREMRDSFQGAAAGDEDVADLDESDTDDDEDYMPEAFAKKDASAPSEDKTATLQSEDETASVDTGSAPQEGLEQEPPAALEEDHQNDARSSVPSASSSSTERE